MYVNQLQQHNSKIMQQNTTTGLDHK